MVPLTRDPSPIRGAQIVEWLKTEVVSGTADLFRGILRGKADLILDSLAHIILACFLIARRLGIGFEQLDRKVGEQIRLHLETGHEVEQWYGDLSACLNYLGDSRKEHGHAQPPGTTRSLV